MSHAQNCVWLFQFIVHTETVVFVQIQQNMCVRVMKILIKGLGYSKMR